jgi:hypothetical protein
LLEAGLLDDELRMKCILDQRRDFNTSQAAFQLNEHPDDEVMGQRAGDPGVLEPQRDGLGLEWSDGQRQDAQAGPVFEQEEHSGVIPAAGEAEHLYFEHAALSKRTTACMCPVLKSTISLTHASV